MQLKNYQKQVLRDLTQYIEVLNNSKSLSEAYSQYWLGKGVSVNGFDNNYIHPYVNTISGTPRVTLKVPTAGGKTFIACNAVKCILDKLAYNNLNKVVAWFVPSDTILKQTLSNLQNPEHPYRQTIDALFGHKVTVVDKEAALLGQGISPVQLHDNLTVFVLSAQSFIETIRVKKDKGAEQLKPRAFRENGSFLEHTQYYSHPEHLINGADPTALIQVIAQQQPLIIVDESHNFKADLRVELLNNLSPRFILELTATPRENSNIISFVDAMQLKRENMVKLPVIVENRNTPKDVLISAIRMRDSLHKHAEELRRKGGKYIRPIVLFQAQPKTDDDNITFDKIKQNLINLGIPERQIKIKTASKDELKGLDLMSEDCDVRYIITVNALKEGWDCPFAYILATLANKTSRVDVEQILGRILRQPYTVQYDNPLLNISYVFTSSNDFRETVENIIRSLQKAGFSKKDFREANPVNKEETVNPSKILPEFFDEPTIPTQKDDGGDGIELTEEETNSIKAELQDKTSDSEIQALQEQAKQISEEYNQQVEQQAKDGGFDPLAAITSKEMAHRIVENYKNVAAEINLPAFYTKTTASIFSNEEWIPLEKTMLTKGFDLPQKDTTVDFTITRPDGVAIDISEQTGDAIRKNSQQAIDYIRQQYMDKSASDQKEALSKQLAYMIKLDSIIEPDIKKYIDRVIAPLDSDQIFSLVDHLYQTKDAIQTKIESLLRDYQKEVFLKWLNVRKIELRPHYSFLEEITISRDSIVGVDKGLYSSEENVNDFEYEVISAVADSPNVLFWHRNREKKDFCINGFINHYPDFIVRMKSGNTVIIETKGDHLVNDDSKNKIFLGNKWADLAGPDISYFMVFQTKEVEGAITVKQLLQILNEL
jgi:type III restriction enzyme